MQRTYGLTLIITCAIFFTPGPAKCADGGERAAKTKIGVSAALTGSAAYYGTGVVNGVLLAQKTYDPSSTVEFLVQDDGFQGKDAASNTQKFIDQDGVRALIIFGSSSSMVAAPIAEKNEIPLIGLATAAELTKERRFVFQHFGSAKKENEAVLNEVARRRYSDVAVVTTAQDGMYSLRDEFLNSAPIKVILNEELMPGETNFRTQVLRVAGARPQAVYLILLPGQPGLFARQLRELGFKGEIFGMHSFEDPREIEISKGALVGTWFVSINPISDESFVSRYKQEFGTEPTITSGYGYDAAKMLIEAARSKSSVVDYLRSNKTFSGVFGTYGLGENSAFDVPVALKVVTEKGFAPLSR